MLTCRNSIHRHLADLLQETIKLTKEGRIADPDVVSRYGFILYVRAAPVLSDPAFWRLLRVCLTRRSTLYVFSTSGCRDIARARSGGARASRFAPGPIMKPMLMMGHLMAARLTCVTTDSLFVFAPAALPMEGL